jgi:hypothetical protein
VTLRGYHRGSAYVRVYPPLRGTLCCIVAELLDRARTLRGPEPSASTNSAIWAASRLHNTPVLSGFLVFPRGDHWVVHLRCVDHYGTVWHVSGTLTGTLGTLGTPSSVRTCARKSSTLRFV